MKTLFIAHRGNTIDFPENTIESFNSAFEKGANGIELDLHFYNNQLIVVHNYLFDRNKRYPTLAEVLKLFSEKGRIEIEIKSFDLDFLLPLKTLLHEYQNADIEITTSVLPIVPYIRGGFPTTSLGIIFLPKDFEEWMTEEFITTKITKMMTLLKANVAHVPWKVLTENSIKIFHENGIKVHSHIYKEALEEGKKIYKEYEEMCRLGVDQCTFDDIRLLNSSRSDRRGV